MTAPDDDMLMAFADGELSPQEAASVEAFLAGAPEAAAKVARLRAARAHLKAAYDPIVEEPVPDRLRALLERPAAPVADLSARRAARTWGAPQFAAMAASLAGGYVIAAALLSGGGDALIVERHGAVIAAAALDEALTSVAAAAAGEPVAIGITFRSTEGDWCRTFGAENMAGLACRENGAWTVKTLVAPEGKTASGDYRLAASASSSAIVAAVEARIEGEPLDAEEEAEAIARGWSQ